MDTTFTPTEAKAETVPFFEDARSDLAPYYNVKGWTIARAKTAITAEIAKMGGAVMRFQEGFFGSAPRRYGYVIEFTLQGKPGRMMVAGLPIRSATATRIEKAKVQALLNVRDWLKSAVTSMIFSPGNNPLVPHLIDRQGQTLVERILEQQQLDVPLLGEIVESGK